MREKLLLKISGKVWIIKENDNTPFYYFKDHQLALAILMYCQQTSSNRDWSISFTRKPRIGAELTYKGIMESTDWTSEFKNKIKRFYNERKTTT